MKALVLSSLILTTLALYETPLSAQPIRDSTQLWRLETKDGLNYIGFIIRQDAQGFQVRNQNGEDVYILKSNVITLTPVRESQLIKGEFWLKNPHHSSYFWGPNGYSLESGTGYYQNNWLFFNQVSIGISKRLSVDGGTIPLFLLGERRFPVWLAPKVSIPVQKNNWHIGAGGLLMSIVNEKSEIFGVLYGVSTWGDREENVSIGVGYGFAGNDWAQTPSFSFSGTIRTGKRGYFITENYFVNTGADLVMILSAGGRRAGKVTLDYGGVIPIVSEMERPIIIPWLGVVVPFGKKQAFKSPGNK